MTNKEILQADLIDIVFENRNKDYGAYALRKNYNHRLLEALGISFALAGILLIINSARHEGNRNAFDVRPDVTLMTGYQKAKPQPIEPPRAKVQPPRAQVPYTGRIQMVDNSHKTEMPTRNQIDTSLVSTKNILGLSVSGAGESINTRKAAGNTKPTDDKREGKSTILTQSEAQFPGGKDAFARFLSKNLIAPEELQVGEKKTVLVRFLVDTEGSISKIEILQSEDETCSKEVIRVLNKMPKWMSAMQNGIKVATWFSQPVTFIGVEQ